MEEKGNFLFVPEAKQLGKEVSFYGDCSDFEQLFEAGSFVPRKVDFQFGGFSLPKHLPRIFVYLPVF